jgi:hypothetical protein
MKKVSMKKLSIAVLTAASILSIGSVEAATSGAKISLKASVPKGSAGDEKAAAGKGLPWLPCTSTAIPNLGGLATTAVTDTLQFDLDVTNPDDDKDASKTPDYDVYVFFINHSLSAKAVATADKTVIDAAAAVPVVGGTDTFAAGKAAVVAAVQAATTSQVTAASAFGGNQIYALVPNTTGIGAPILTSFANANVLAAAAPSTYRLAANPASFKSTIFGGPIPLEFAGANALPQGMWSAIAIMVRPDAAGIAAVTPNQIQVDPTTGAAALQDPRNWVAWAIQPFILGTPFGTAVGTTTTGTCQ